MKKKQSLFNREKIEKQLREFGNKLDELQAKAEKATKSKYNETRESLLAQFDELFKKLNYNIDSQMNELGAKIEKLTGKAKEEAKKEYEEMRTNAYRNMEEYKKSLMKLKGSGSSAWVEIKTGSAKAWKEMKDSFRNAASKCK